MADLPESNEYPSGIYQIETTDPVLGGPPNEATKAGLANIPAMQLAKRTNWLKRRVDDLLGRAIAATTLVAGLVRLSNATSSTSETEAATPRAVKAVWDNAETRALKTTAIGTGGLATGGGNLSADRNITVPVATQAEAEAGVLDTRAMTPLKVMQAIAARLAGRTVATSGLAFGGGNLSADRTITVPDATKAEAEAGTITTKAMSPLRVAQAIGAQLSARTVGTSGLATGGGNLSTDRTISVPIATQAEAQAGTNNSKAMTPLRTADAIASQYESRSITTNGYQVLPSGLIIQWGSFSGTTRSTATDGVYESEILSVTWPISFPTACLRVITGAASDVAGAGLQEQSWSRGYTASSGSFYVACRTPSALLQGSFFAIGH